MNVHVPMMRIGPNDRLGIDGIDYRMRQRLPQGYVLARVDDPGVIEEFSHDRLHLLSQTARFRFDRGAFDIAAIAARMESDADLLADIPEEEREMVLARRFYATAFLKMEADKKATRSDASMKVAIKDIDAAFVDHLHKAAAKRNENGDLIAPRPEHKRAALSISPRTLRTWLRKFENAGLRATALRSGYRRCGDRVTARLDPAIKRLLAEHALLYATENQPKIRDVYGLLTAALDAINSERIELGMPALPAPSYDRLRAEIRGMSEFDVYSGRYGPPAARKRFLMVANGPDVERPLQRVEMDEWRIDLMTILENAEVLDGLPPEQQEELRRKRYWVCVAIDVATRVILGMKVAAGVSAELAIETLEMVVSPKRRYADAVGAGSAWDHHGSPESIVHDQGAAFMSGAFRRTIIDLGCDPDAPPAGLAWLRGTIERVFRTMGSQALAPFTGRTFGSVDAKGDYKPEERASLTVAELCQVLVRWVVDVYHNTPHAGLGGETPASAWSRLVGKFGIIPAPDRHVRRAIFGTDLTRTVTARGVRCLGLFYNSLELQAHRRHYGDADVEVKLDAWDLGHVSVRLGAGWTAIPCMRTGFDDVPTDIWLAASKDLRRRFVEEAKLTDALWPPPSATPGRWRTRLRPAPASRRHARAATSWICSNGRSVAASRIPTPPKPRSSARAPTSCRRPFPVESRARPRRPNPSLPAPSSRGADIMNDDIIASIRAAMPAAQVHLADNMALVRAEYIETDMDDRLAAALDALLRTLVSRQPIEEEAQTGKTETRAIIVSGEAGAGKTASLDNAFRTHPVLGGYGTLGSGCPIARVVVPAPCTLKALGTAILQALGYPLARELREHAVWTRVHEALRTSGTVILHLDEMHNLTDRANVAELDAIRKALKGLMVSREWPVGLVVSGLPSLVEAMREIDEVRRRGRFIRIPALSDADTALLGEPMKRCCEIAGVTLPEGLPETIGGRLAHAGLYRYGIAVELIHEAIETALLEAAKANPPEDAGVLATRHFADAYAARTGCGDRMNPFVAPDWYEIDASQVLLDEMPPEPVMPGAPKPRRGRKKGS